MDGRGKANRVGDHPVVPDYGGACIANVVPALLEPGPERPSWFPAGAIDASQVVLLVLDGLGWEQLETRRHLAPTLSAMAGGPITSVVPSTTATALTSIATGLTPGEHGVVGYRVAVDGEVLNILRWTTPSGDARGRIDPYRFQPQAAFCGQRPSIVTKAEFVSSGFSGAHLSDVRFHGYRVPSTLVAELRRQLRAGEPFVYAYYDGIDKVSHEYGLGEFFDAEIAAADRLVADILSVLPRDAALVITADHGQVDVGDQIVALSSELLDVTALLSGEGRFQWLHARPGLEGRLLETARDLYCGQAWVRERDEAVADGWFGGPLSSDATTRLGDVVLAPFEPVAFLDPGDVGEVKLRSRHGSLTSAEMLVPLLAAAS